MTKVIFKKVSIKNFLSIGREPVEVAFKKGVHILTGQNLDKQDRRNGVGKSTVADAIHFALFGSTIRNLKKDHMINNLTCDTTEVVLDFDVNRDGKIDTYRIVRQLAPSRCFLYVNEEDKTRDSITNTTDMIAKIVEGSPEVFQNCVIMTLNNTTPFMAQKKQDKRRFIESVFDLEIFSTMVSQLRSDYSECKIEHDQELAKMNELTQSISLLETEKTSEITRRQEQKEKYETRRANNAAEIASLRNQLVELDEEQRDNLKKKIIEVERQLEKCDNTINKLTYAAGQHRTAIKMNEEYLQKIHNGTDSTCPRCLRDLDDLDLDHISDERAKIQKIVSTKKTLVAQVDETVQKLSKTKISMRDCAARIRGEIKDFDKRKQENEGHLQRISQLEEWQASLEHDLHALDIESIPSSNVYDTSVKRLKEIQDALQNIKTHLKILDVVKFVVSEEGVKSYIVKQILHLFNNKLAYYLRRLDSNCVCIFNEYFEEEIISEKGKMCVYENFSGAERKAIDLACLFTFMDIRRLQGNISYNVSIYDELLDTSVDEKGIEMVLDILRERAEQNGECIIIISHRKESVKNAAGDVIFLQKENGITTRKEYVDES